MATKNRKTYHNDTDSIKEYKDKLYIWDKMQLPFQDVEHVLTDIAEILNIAPMNILERQVYNEWLISHWRNSYISQEYGLSKFDENPNIRVIPYETLIKNLQENPEYLKTRRQTLLQELEAAKKKIVAITNGRHKQLAKEIYIELRRGHMMNLYSYAFTVHHRFITNRIIGRLLDITQYLIHVEKEISGIGKVSELDFMDLKKYSEGTVESLYNLLISEKCMDCTFLLFKQVFRLEPKANSDKILWNGLSEKNGANKQTLLQLVLGASGSIVSLSMVHKFLQNNFKSSDKSMEIDKAFIYDNVKASWYTYRKKKKDDIKGTQKLISEWFSNHKSE